MDEGAREDDFGRGGGGRRVEEVVGLMEPRPNEIVGWGIGEVLLGQRR